MKIIFKVLFSLAILSFSTTIDAQFRVEGYLDIGKTAISKGFYSQLSCIGLFEKPKWGVQGGCNLGLVQAQDVIINSLYMSSYGKLKIGNNPLYLGGEYLWTAFSPDLRETNWILFARTTLAHWQLGLGTSTRTYRFSYKAEQPFGSESRIIERWNIMYKVKYLLEPGENRWNLSFAITDYDNFIIQQENNPMFNFRFDYKVRTPLSVYSELWYKSAGLMVIKVTYYGMFLRFGLLWDI